MRGRAAGWPIGIGAAALVATEAWATRALAPTLVLAAFTALSLLLLPWVWNRAGARTSGRLLYLALVVGLVLLAAAGAPRWLHYESFVLHPAAVFGLMFVVAMAGVILAQHQRLDRSVETLSREAEDARLLAIRKHLDPHFLFNTLGAIAEWCREDPVVAERALLELSAMLRTLFDGVREPAWPLAREVELLVALHRLYELRDDERYQLETQLDVPSIEVPPLALLPLFENALTHGDAAAPTRLEVDAEGVRIWNAGAIGARREGGTGIATAERRLELAGHRVFVRPRPHEGVPGTLAEVTWS